MDLVCEMRVQNADRDQVVDKFPVRTESADLCYRLFEYMQRLGAQLSCL